MFGVVNASFWHPPLLHLKDSLAFQLQSNNMEQFNRNRTTLNDVSYCGISLCFARNLRLFSKCIFADTPETPSSLSSLGRGKVPYTVIHIKLIA